ncbi:MAG: nucleotidyltransferase family protein [Bacteroidaceae bacterium]
MKTQQRQFLDLIRFALMGKDLPTCKIHQTEWADLLKMAKEQAVVGLLYAALEKMPQDRRPQREALLDFFSIVLQIEQANHKLNTSICSLFAIYRKLGGNPMLLKGQGVGKCYLHPEWRNSGDIDVFVSQNFDKVHEWTIANGEEAQEYEPDFDKHVNFKWDGVTVENHFLLARFYNRRTDRSMQAITQEGLKIEAPLLVQIEGQDIELLPPTLGLLQLITHFSHHLMDWGVGIRQLCDIVMYMHTYHRQINAERLNRWLTELDLARSAGAVATIGVRYLGLPTEEVPLHTKQGERYADKLLQLVMESGNFGCIELGAYRRPLLWRIQFYGLHCIKSYQLMPREVRSVFLGKAKHVLHRLKKGDTNI